MSDIVLTTLNARYIHAAFGLRYLMANLGELRPRARILEFEISQRPLEIAEMILAQNPKVIGLGVYIWNVSQTTQLVADLKRVRPDIAIVLGGPEVSFETEQQEVARLADHVLTGEADLAFAELCRQLLSGLRPGDKIIPAPLPDFNQLVLPYDLYDDRDVAHRIIYVEASRGCPFSCEFCLSSLDIPVRNVPLDGFLASMQSLLDRGVKHFKFVDRTFNLNLRIGQAILQFFQERYRPGLFLHFEMIPDRLPEALREMIGRFPNGALQFEVGIQSFNEEVCKRISRRQDNAKAEDNLRWLREHTGVHIHADLIAGLPGETLESIAAGFDRLVALQPQEIQFGILKRLRGTPIVRHDTEWGMVYSPNPPYEVLQTRLLDFPTMQRLRRFARYYDLVANSGNFRETAPMIWAATPAGNAPYNRNSDTTENVPPHIFPLPRRGAERSELYGCTKMQTRLPSGERPGQGCRGIASPFWNFLRFSDWLYERVGRTHAIQLTRLSELLFQYLCEKKQLDRSQVAQMLWRDYQRGGRRDRPAFLCKYVAEKTDRPKNGLAALPRQARHLV